MPRINIHYINIPLYMAIGWLVFQYHGPLRWALDEVPRYSRDNIASPIERKLYKHAEAILKSSTKIDPARVLLDRSLSIDPNTEARFLLGKYYEKKGDNSKALQHYKHYLQIDPTVLITYVEIARILESQGKSEDARLILKQGFDYFDKYHRQFRPSLNPQVSDRYNDSAANVYKRYLRARRYLKARLSAYAH
ncbi:MAG: hypothetical protein HOC23_05080 [Halieaceae bacterium]|nr:hypothetical protein [Halieaceae bacterium]